MRTIPKLPRMVLGAALAAVVAGGVVAAKSRGGGEFPCARIADGLAAVATEVADDLARLDTDFSLAALDEGRAWARDGCPDGVYPGQIAHALATREGLDVAGAPAPPGYSNVQSSPAIGVGR